MGRSRFHSCRFCLYRATTATLLLLLAAAMLSAEEEMMKSSRTEKVLFEFGCGFDLTSVETEDAQVELVLQRDIQALRISTGHQASWPGITLEAPEGVWDLSQFTNLEMEVANVGDHPMDLHWRIDSPWATGEGPLYTRQIRLAVGEQKLFQVPLLRSLPEWLAPRLFGMRGFPGGLAKERVLDPAQVSQFIIFVNRPDEDYVFELGQLRATGSYQPPTWLGMDEEAFFPFIDAYGQFMHDDWPGKVHSDSDFAANQAAEQADLEAHEGPAEWDRWGGWVSGAQLEPTGHFRVEKVEDRWWLVDPDGRIFWSHGVDCVGSGNGTTPITDRKYWYRDLPSEDSPLAQFYGRGAWAPHNYYEGKTYETYNFTASNLLRKYGEDWAVQYAELAHRRLRSWGLNTIANWSDAHIYGMRRTPYVVPINFGGKLLAGSEGYWGKFRDVFDPSFREALRQSLEWQKDRTADDPWCIGYFVDNEIAWGDEVSLALAALASPADQSAKGVFIEDLRAKYGEIERLNSIWQTTYASWEALRQSQDPPEREWAEEDLRAFYTKVAETYFRTCREEVKRVAPNTLYLGCRFAWANELAVRAAAQYCDVISYNFYRREIADVRLPDGIDKPIIVGEFHFGALDRGMFHTGLVPVENQEARAEAYRNYVSSALSNPYIVGTHWFQYGDQATTGRGDGENYQIGLLNITDTPYPETIEAVRDVGYRIYRLRTGGN